MADKRFIPEDAVWLITGSSSGVGKAFAEQVSKNGSYRLIASARKLSDLDYLPDGPTIHKTVLDITQPDSIKSMVAQVLRTFGRIDVVVNPVGSSLFGDFEAIPDDKARTQFELNFWGAANLLRESLRVMREENPKTGPIGGVFCQVSGVSGRVTYPGGTFYIASRFAWEGLMKSLSRELRPEWNVNLMTVHPQAVQTDYLKKSTTLVDRHPAYVGYAQGAEMWFGALTQHHDLSSFGTPAQLVRTIGNVIEKGVPGQGIPLQLPAGADSWLLTEKALEKEQRLHREQKEVAWTAAPEDQRAPHIEVFI